MENFNDDSKSNMLEAAQVEFLRAWEQAPGGAGEDIGNALPELARRFPQIAEELTEWALNFVARQKMLQSDTETDQVSEMTSRIVADAKNAVQARPNNINEAVAALRLSQFKLAERLRLVPSITSELCNGLVTGWPALLEQRLADALLLPVSRIPDLLANSRPAAANFSASGSPDEMPYSKITFREAIEDAIEGNDISPDDAGFWLSALDCEGK